MIVCTVHEPPEPASDRIERAERLVFVRDRFSWMAALLTPIWLLVHRHWLPLLGFILAAVAIVFAVAALGLAPFWGSLLIFALQLVIGFEAGSLDRWRLDRKGWQMIGTVAGRGGIDCERRFLDSWLPSQPILLKPDGATQPVPARGRRGWLFRRDR